MKYREIIKKIQHDTGFSDAESEEALEQTITSIAERLTLGERKDFASQLPPELQEVALSAEMPERYDRHEDIIQEVMEKEGIEEERAKKQILSAWNAIRSFISPGEIRDIKSQLPDNVAALLY